MEGGVTDKCLGVWKYAKRANLYIFLKLKRKNYPELGGGCRLPTGGSFPPPPNVKISLIFISDIFCTGPHYQIVCPITRTFLATGLSLGLLVMLYSTVCAA